MNRRLGALYTPQGVTLVRRLPLTPMGKIDKRSLLRATAAAGPPGS